MILWQLSWGNHNNSLVLTLDMLPQVLVWYVPTLRHPLLPLLESTKCDQMSIWTLMCLWPPYPLLIMHHPCPQVALLILGSVRCADGNPMWLKPSLLPHALWDWEICWKIICEIGSHLGISLLRSLPVPWWIYLQMMIRGWPLFLWTTTCPWPMTLPNCSMWQPLAEKCQQPVGRSRPSMSINRFSSHICM